jgi:hypothetical protein
MVKLNLPFLSWNAFACAVALTSCAPPADDPQPLGPHKAAISWVEAVGSRVPFNKANSLDLASYCNGNDTNDDSGCMESWLVAAKAQRKDLYVSPGTYYYSRSWVLWNGVRLKCANPDTTVFKSNSRNVGIIFGVSPQWGPGNAQNLDISFEDCGYDLNGAVEGKHTAILYVLGNSYGPAQYVTIRGNKMYDSAMTGTMNSGRDNQRSYINGNNGSADWLIENNHLSEGGRIGIGGSDKHRLVIRNNTLDNINDNAITISNSGNPGEIADILIEGNTITNPIGSGIFVGQDGQGAYAEGMIFRDITIRNNVIKSDARCTGADYIFGCLTTMCIDISGAWDLSRIYVAGNNCHKAQPVKPGEFPSGFGVLTSGRDITFENNILTAPTAAYSGAAVSFMDSVSNLCLIANDVSAPPVPVGFYGGSFTGKMTGNNWHGGVIDDRVGALQTLDRSGSTSGCYQGLGVVTAPSGGTLGYNSVGSYTETASAGRIGGSKAVASANLTVTSISMYLANATGNGRLALFANNGGLPGMKLAETSQMSLANGWNTGAISSVDLTSGTTYWLVFMLSSTPTIYGELSASGAGIVTDSTFAFGAFPSSFPASNTTIAKWSIYASGTGGPLGFNAIGSYSELASLRYIGGSKAVARSAMSVSTLSMYLTDPSGGHGRLALYTDNGGLPGTKIAETASLTLVSGWNSGSIGNQNLSSGATYWLVFQFDVQPRIYDELPGGALAWSRMLHSRTGRCPRRSRRRVPRLPSGRFMRSR